MEPIDSWRQVPDAIQQAIAGLSENELDAIAGAPGMNARETVHHVAEANIVASSMIIAAIGASGSTYDWSWLFPNPAWAKRMSYDRLPVRTAVLCLRGLIEHVSAIAAARPDALQCEIRRFDTPGGETYTKTVEAIIREEVDHAREHLGELRRNVNA